MIINGEIDAEQARVVCTFSESLQQNDVMKSFHNIVNDIDTSESKE